MRSAFVAFAACLAAAASPTSAHAAGCGDLNNSGGSPATNIADVVLLFRAVLENPDPTPLCGGSGAAQCGDVNDDGAITIQDVVILFNQVLGNETLFPLCEGEGPTIACPGGTATITSNVSSNQVWPAGCNILLDGTIFVEPNVVLTIRAGATIKGKKFPANPPPTALVFRRDSKINAPGTESNPIVFSSDQSPGNRAAGDWAGLALNGRAPVNCDGGECDAEGLNNVPFGGSETNDSSGVVRFLRIEFAGRELSPDNELNVFTMNGVGRGTSIDHIHAHMGLDDAHEWFGGNVNSKFMLASAPADDLLDWQIGFTGATQYAAAIQFGGNIDADGSRGFEGDNNEDDFEASPRSNPKFCNVTLMGAKSQPGGNVQAQCMELRRGTSAQVWKTICFNWNTSGIRMSDAATGNNACNAGPSLSGNLMVQESILFNVGPDPGTTYYQNNANTAGADCTSTAALGALWDATSAPNQKGVDPGFPAGCGTTFGCVPVPSQNVATSESCSAVDPFFENVGYIGAFDPNGDANGWANPPWVNFATN